LKRIVGIPESEYTPIKVDHFRRETELPLKEKEFQFEFSRKQKEDQHEFDMWLKREKAKLELELQREGGLSDIKIDTKKAEAQIEWKNFKKTKDYAVQASILSNLSEVAEIGYLTQALLTTIETIYEIESLPDAGRYINQLEVFKRNKQKLVDLIDGRFQQLL
jgi:hypothetical protein